jgi:hypothetical protein
MVSSLDRLQSGIPMDITADVLWVLSCRTMDGMVDDSQAASKLLGTLVALRCACIDKNLLIDMNDSVATI